MFLNIFYNKTLNPLMPGGNKKGHTYLNKPATFSFQVCLSMCDLLLPPGIFNYFCKKVLSQMFGSALYKLLSFVSKTSLKKTSVTPLELN